MEAAGFEPCICTGRSTVLLCHAHQFELSFRISYVLNYIRNLRNCKILRVFNDIVILTVAIPGKAYRTEFFLFPNSCIKYKHSFIISADISTVYVFIRLSIQVINSSVMPPVGCSYHDFNIIAVFKS